MLAIFQEVLDKLNSAIVIWDSAKTLVYANRYAKELFDANPLLLDEITVLLETDDKTKENAKLRCCNKILMPSRYTLSAGEGHFDLLCLDDVSRLDELEDINYSLSTILNSLNEGVLLADADGKIEFYNNQLKDFEGLDPKKILGRHITEVYKVNSLNSEHLTVQKTMSPIIDRYQKYQTFQDKEVHLVASTYPVLKDGRLISTYSVSRNIGKVKELMENTQLLQKNYTPIVENLIMDATKNNTRYTLGSIVGNSPKLRSLIEKAKRAAHVSSPILIYGKTGTGKELFVQGIHNENPVTKNHPFVAINCAAIPEALLESLLFGTVQGAFTGAKSTSGLIEHAGHGTLFLDEINSMPLGLQAKLLRVMQENRYRRLGGKEELTVNCRVISSTNVPPSECLEKLLLRKDLYYRISVISFTLPPLRERCEDIPILADHFARLYSIKYGKPMISISDKLKSAFSRYDWPGNIRELEHVIESCVTMMDAEDTILPEHLPVELRTVVQTQDLKIPAPNSLASVLLDAEKNAISSTLDEYCWNISKSAKLLGISRQNLQYRIQKLAIKKEDRI